MKVICSGVFSFVGPGKGRWDEQSLRTVLWSVVLKVFLSDFTEVRGLPLNLPCPLGKGRVKAISYRH